ncbi:hypothetical protein SCT_0342 [Sulfuricella sp. T08]|uniref:surface-adhesin E family protein n=1 Tax=Sulfuricella sp. T08 TaxID=1632857 RepID=UPI00061796EB|nr:surface-adhesin E family protein [Sulfuricella sp. T08]GAO34962.1 hypothetical protein SCT_0342 [Sulfuricella sp. T08]
MQLTTLNNIERHAFQAYPLLQTAKHLTMLLALTTCCPAHAAEEWLTIPTSSDNITFSIDKVHLERSGKVVKFWEKIVYTQPMVKDETSGKMIKEKKMHRIMNCAERTQGLLHGVTYSEQGNFITSLSLDEDKTQMTAIPYNTVAEIEFEIVCADIPSKPD